MCCPNTSPATISSSKRKRPLSAESSTVSIASTASLASTLIDIEEDNEEDEGPHKQKRARRAGHLIMFKLVEREQDLYQCLLCDSKFKGVGISDCEVLG